jgi:hypothetical protein
MDRRPPAPGLTQTIAKAASARAATHPRRANVTNRVTRATKNDDDEKGGEKVETGLYQTVFNDDPLFGEDSVFSGEGGGS